MNADMLLSEVQFSELYLYLTGKERFGSGPAMGSVTCNHTLRYTIKWIKDQGVQDIRGNIEKIADLGGHCDCEVLLNVTPDSWEERRGEEIIGPDSIGEIEWQQFISSLLENSGMEAS